MATKRPTATETSWQTTTTAGPINLEHSKLFVKKLVAMSISHILYLRGLLPEDAFKDREFDGVRVKIINDKSKFAPAIQIVEWIKGAFEAFDKKYLERMEFIFFAKELQKTEILESYSFTFTYDNGHVSVTYDATKDDEIIRFKIEEVRFAALQILQHTTPLIQNMKKVTENTSMRVRLYYYDVTPAEYEPPGFDKGPDFEYTFEPSNLKLRHGKVDTGFHSIKLNSRIGVSRFREPHELSEDVRNLLDIIRKKRAGNQDSQTELMNCIPSSQPLPEEERSVTTQQSPQSTTTVKDSIQSNNAVEELMQKDKSDSQEDSGSFIKETPTDVQNAIVHCACGISEDEGLLIFCDSCRRWNHAICYRFINEKTLPSNFCCIFCHNSTPEAQCIDGSLINLSEDKRKMICLYRRALGICLSSWRVDKKILASELSVTSEVADNLLYLLEADKVFSSSKKRGKGPYHHINLTYLKEVVIPAYFQKGLVQVATDLKNSQHDKKHENYEDENPIKEKQVKMAQSINTVEMSYKK